MQLSVGEILSRVTTVYDLGSISAQVEIADFSSRSRPARPCTQQSFHCGCGSLVSG
jgi:hypothetical protein